MKLPPTAESEHSEATGAADSERRLWTRHSCYGSAECIILQPKTLFRGFIRDLSATGCFGETRANLPVERLSQVELRCVVNGRQYHLSARVMSIRRGIGMGLEFLVEDTEG